MAREASECPLRVPVFIPWIPRVSRNEGGSIFAGSQILEALQARE
jgi:hypothetical protein